MVLPILTGFTESSIVRKNEECTHAFIRFAFFCGGQLVGDTWRKLSKKSGMNRDDRQDEHDLTKILDSHRIRKAGTRSGINVSYAFLRGKGGGDHFR